MNNGKVRIYELSKELELENKDILTICEELNIAVKSHSSTISGDDAKRIEAVAKSSDYKPSSKTARKPERPNPPARNSSSGAVIKPKRPRQQQILEIRRYPTKPKAPEAAPEATVAKTAPPTAAPSTASQPVTKPVSRPSLSGPPSRPGTPGRSSESPREGGSREESPREESPRESASSAGPDVVLNAPPAPAKPARTPEKIVTTSTASPDQLRPKLVEPPSRPSRSAPRDSGSSEASRVAKPVLKRDRSDDDASSNVRPSRPSPGGRSGGDRKSVV